METHRITHRQRIENCLSGSTSGQTPVALWRHFPVDDQTPEGLAGAVINFQKTFDFDLVKVTPSSSYCLTDWGVQDFWRGNTEGTREYGKRLIEKPDDWYKLVALDPYKGNLGGILNCLKMICDELGADIPIIQTLFSPLAQAKNLVGGSQLIVHIRKYPEAVQAGLTTIADSITRFIEAANQLEISGYFYAVQHASYQLLTEEEFNRFGRAFDLEILKAVDKKWLNMVHLHGLEVMFSSVLDYPVQVINWHDRETSPSLAEGQKLFKGTLCGGLQRERMELGTPEQVYSEAKDAITSTGNKRFILGTGCVMPITTPRANILAALQSCKS